MACIVDEEAWVVPKDERGSMTDGTADGLGSSIMPVGWSRNRFVPWTAKSKLGRFL
jgi:hypothetical protein